MDEYKNFRFNFNIFGKCCSMECPTSTGGNSKLSGNFSPEGIFFSGSPFVLLGYFFKSIFPGAVFGDSVEAITVIRG